MMNALLIAALLVGAPTDDRPRNWGGIFVWDGDLDGYDLTIDQDGDSALVGDRDGSISDDELGLKFNGALDFIFKANNLELQSGSTITFGTNDLSFGTSDLIDFSDNEMALDLNGTADQYVFNGTAFTSKLPFYLPQGTDSNAAIAASGDPNTGIRWNGADILRIVSGGSGMMNFIKSVGYATTNTNTFGFGGTAHIRFTNSSETHLQIGDRNGASNVALQYGSDATILDGTTNGVLIVNNAAATQGIKFDTATTANELILTDESGNAALVRAGNGFSCGASAPATFNSSGLIFDPTGDTVRVGTSDESGGLTRQITFGSGDSTNAGDVVSGDVLIKSGDTTTDGDTGDVTIRTGAAGAGPADAGDIIFQRHGANTAMTIDGETGSVDVYDTSGNGAYWSETEVDASAVSPGGSGATLTVGGPGSASIYYQLDAVDEYLYFTADVHDDWDGASDIVVSAKVAVDGAEDASDDIEAEVIAEYFGEHEDMDVAKTQTRTVNHDIASYNAAGSVHYLTFVLDWDLTDNVVQADDILKLRFRLDGVGSVAAVRFLYANIKFRTSKPRQETGGTFPSEG